MTLDDAASILWRRKLLLGFTLLLSIGAVVAVTMSLPNVYQATTTLYVGAGQRTAQFDTNVGEQLTRTYTTLASNANVADEVTRSLPFPMERKELLDRVSFVPVERTQLLQITAEGVSPQAAQTIANTYATVFTRRVAGQFRLGSTQTRVSINEPAAMSVPPSGPNRPLYIGIGSLLALLLSAGAALLRERLDKRLRISEDDDTVLGAPILARIPQVPRNGAHEETLRDTFRLLKTNIDFANDEHSTSVVITSPGPVEGKSTIAAHLALACAADGERVLLIEADLRRPGLGSTVVSRSERSGIGLTNYLGGFSGADRIVDFHPEIENLKIIWSGPLPPDPGSLLRSRRFYDLLKSAGQTHDRVIIDTPPVSIGADASIVASWADGTIYVVDARSTARGMARAGLNQLRNVQARVLGLIVNNAPGARVNDHYYYRQSTEGGLTRLPSLNGKRGRTRAGA